MLIDTIFFKPLNKSMVIVHYIPGLFFAKLVLFGTDPDRIGLLEKPPAVKQFLAV